VTKLAKWIRRKRIIHNELLYDMAKRIGKKSSTLSGIENQRIYADVVVFAYLLHEYADSADDAKLLGEAFDEHIAMDLISRENIGGICYISKSHVDDTSCECNDCRLKEV